MSKHTPGPWRYVEDEDDGIHVVHGCVVGPTVTVQSSALSRTRADMKLIAAAPELLAALEHYLTQDEIAEDYGGGVGGSAREQARAAIAKATGEAQ